MDGDEFTLIDPRQRAIHNGGQMMYSFTTPMAAVLSNIGNISIFWKKLIIFYVQLVKKDVILFLIWLEQNNSYVSIWDKPF